MEFLTKIITTKKFISKYSTLNILKNSYTTKLTMSIIKYKIHNQQDNNILYKLLLIGMEFTAF